MARSLKEQNNWKLWLIVAANSLFYFTVLEANEIRVTGLSALLTQARTLVPVGVAGVVATVLNALPSSELKATLIYWRLKYALPGHRAFTVHARRDTRIDQDRLSKIFKGRLPATPEDQNSAWYKMYKSVRKDVVINDAHRTFLLLRDYTALSALFVLIFGCTGFYYIQSKGVSLAYFVILAVQYLIVRQAAHNAGVRMVTNVLALKTSGR